MLSVFFKVSYKHGRESYFGARLEILDCCRLAINFFCAAFNRES